MYFIWPLIGGLVIGTIITLTISWLLQRNTRKILQEVISQTESQKIKDLEMIVSRLKESFSALSFEALSKNTGEFLKLAHETLSKQTQAGEKELEGKNKLIDQTLVLMKNELQRIQNLMNNLEKDREGKFHQIAEHLKFTAQQTEKLRNTTNKLQTALVNTSKRGQWGERMAEDILRSIGFIKGINYQKNKTMQTVNTRPDYTFFLPQNLIVNMDVKFPLDNYLRYLEIEEGPEKQRFKKQFLKDARDRIKEVTTKDYINPAENTVDYMILFIPNEQVYAFINENGRTLLDEALKEKVIVCSPLTLYAILATIRQAVDNFNVEKTASRILSLFGEFNKQWNTFLVSLERMGKKINDAQKEFNILTSRRRNQLERPLEQIEEIRKQKMVETEAPLLNGKEVISQEFSNQEKTINE